MISKMAHSVKQRDKIINDICEIVRSGEALRNACKKIKVSTASFYKYIDDNEEYQKQYARACEERAENIFEDILKIADSQENDVIDTEHGPITNHNAINRNRTQIEARKWMLSKLQPKKYGDKLDLTTGGDKLTDIKGITFDK